MYFQVTNGLLNSHPPGRFSGDSATGIEQKRKKPNMLKNFITNASFKAKKLPGMISIMMKVLHRICVENSNLDHVFSSCKAVQWFTIAFFSL